IEVHFWITTPGVVAYIAAMWLAGVTRGLLWRATGADGPQTYSFGAAGKGTYPFDATRLLGGHMYLSRVVILPCNTRMTVRAGTKGVNPEVPLYSPDARDPALRTPVPATA